jgi:hypothetical protein
VQPASAGTRRAPPPLAFLAPLMCAFHCIAAPVMVLVVPGVALSGRAEWLLLSLTGALAAWLFARGWLLHRRVLFAAVGLGGLLLWSLSVAHLTRGVPEAVSTMLGALAVAAAMYGNSRAQRGTSRCSCPQFDSCDTVAEERSGSRR